MLKNITLETATIILPITDIDYSTSVRLNDNLGSSVLVEENFETESYTEFYIDYGLIGYTDIKDAEAEARLIYNYMQEYLGTDGTVDADQWEKELNDYREKRRQEEIELTNYFLQDTLNEGPDATRTTTGWYTQEQIDSDSNIVARVPLKQNNEGRILATETYRKYPTVNEFNDKVNRLKKELSDLETA